MSAIVYTGMRRYSKARSKAVGRYRRKAFLVWYCILALGSFFVLNWIYQTSPETRRTTQPDQLLFCKKSAGDMAKLCTAFRKVFDSRRLC